MPISMPTDTRTVLGADAAKCESRSLFLNRFAYPDAKDSGNDHRRRDWFNKLCGKQALSVAAGCRSDWLVQTTVSEKSQILFAQLQSRLMVNMAGGVMENAGLCLDRFGLPYIPGSAVKGCARRTALVALHEWCETGVKPVGDDNLFTVACASFNSQAEMLTAIARVFGWGEQEWKTRDEVLKSVSPRRDEDDAQFQRRCQKLWEEKRSDFAWACDIPPAAAAQTPAPTGRTIPAQGNALGNASKTNPSPVRATQIPATGWLAIRDETLKLLVNAPNFAGSVSFLPAHPVDVPGKSDGLPLPIPPLGKLELDIVTCHHGDYYGQKKDSRGNLIQPVATDTEEPVPVVFPTVAAGHVFAFALLPLRGSHVGRVSDLPVPGASGSEDASGVGAGSGAANKAGNTGSETPSTGRPEVFPTFHARTWLATGLQTFGLGAKTAAGYGWFDTSHNTHKSIANSLEKIRRDREAAEAKAKQEAEDKAKQEEAARRKKALDEKLAQLTPEQQEDAKVETLTDDQFRSALDNYARRDGAEQRAIMRAMRHEQNAAGSRRAFWDDLKAKAQKKGGKYAQTEQAIRQLSKQMFPGKEGKMP